MVKRTENRIKWNNWDKTCDIMDKQLIKIPSQKIISFTDFSHLLSFSYFLFFFFFLQKWKYRFFHVLCKCPFKKNYSTNESSLKYIYSCTIGLCKWIHEKQKKFSASFYIKKLLYRYGLKRVIINNIKRR